MAGAFPRPWCVTCAAGAACRGRGEARADYPGCRVPPRVATTATVRSLFDWWRRYHPVDDERVARLEAMVLARLPQDSGYSEIFEPSWSIDAQGWHLRRFSYAFPGLRGAEADTLATLSTWASTLGAGVGGHVARLARALRQPCVEQVLFGVAYDGERDWRVKLYLQFGDAAGREALQLTRAIVASGDLTGIADGAPLHLCGLDLGDAGLTGAKLYFLHRELRASAAATMFGETLAGWGDRTWRNLLRIHRLRGAGAGSGSRADEVDFLLAENDLLPEDVAALLGGPKSPYELLRRELPIALRRLSLAVGGGKVNGYYVMTS